MVPASPACPAFGLDDLLDDLLQVVGELPAWIVVAELPHVADPPDVIAGSGRIGILPLEFPADALLTTGDRFEHGTVALPAAAKVVDLPRPRISVHVIDGADDVGAVNVVAHLFGAVAMDGVGRA